MQQSYIHLWSLDKGVSSCNCNGLRDYSTTSPDSLQLKKAIQFTCNFVQLSQFLLSRKLVNYVNYENAELVLKLTKPQNNHNKTNGFIIAS